MGGHSAAAYVICLSDSEFENARRNITIPVTKFDAIKGASLPPFDPAIMTIGAYRSITCDKERQSHASLPSMNAVGCALSHSNLWKLVQPGSGMYIFESDAVLKVDPEPHVQKFLQEPSPHVLFLGLITIPQRKHNHTTSRVKSLKTAFYGTHGYYITYEGAQLLLRYMFPIEQQIDAYLSDLIRLGSKLPTAFHAYYVCPIICTQSAHPSTIQTKTVIQERRQRRK